MKTLKLYEEFLKGDLEINLGLELEKVAREGRELTFQQFLDSFGIRFGDVDGKEMGKALMDQMKYRKMSDDEFNKLYNEYKGEEVTNESFMETLQLFAIGFFLWKFIFSILKNKFNNKKNDLIEENIINLLDILKEMKKVPVIELGDRYFIRISLGFGDTADIRILKDIKIIIFETKNGTMEYKLTDEQYNDFISLLNKKDIKK